MAAQNKQPFITQIAAAFNKQGFGEVCTPAQLRDLLISHGFTPQEKFPLDKLVAKLIPQAAAQKVPQPKPVTPVKEYKTKREQANARSREKSKDGRSIGQIPAVVDPKRREDCRNNLALFLITYFPDVFAWEFSQDHLDLIRQIELTVFEGGLFVYAVYRGFGKTAIARGAAVWMLLYGHAEVVPIICSTKDSAERSLQFVRIALWKNALLLEDFPEACYPIVSLEGSNRRSQGQLYETPDGRHEHTHVNFEKDVIQLACIEGYAASGSVVVALSLEGEIRGLNFVTADGRSLRPRVGIVDDPQTKESAQNPDQVAKRLDIIMRDILMSGGHNDELSLIVPATIIESDDLIDQLFDHNEHPEWVGRKVKMLKAMPERMDLWEEYGRIQRNYRESSRQDQQRAKREAAEFYLENRDEMDRGAEPAWTECYKRSDKYCELSAIQHAMNFYTRYGEKVFMTECQNTPDSGETSDEALTAQKIMDQVEERLPRGKVPPWADLIVAGIDIHDDMLFWQVYALRREDFRGHLLDYGAWPKQNRLNFTQGRGQGRITLKMKYRGMGKEGALRKGLQELTEYLTERLFEVEDGSQKQIERIGYDSNYQTRLIYEFCADDPRVRVPLAGAYDTYQGAVGFFEKKEARTSRIQKRLNGTGYKSKPIEDYPKLRLVTYEANYAKTFFRERLLTAKGDKGAFTIFKGDRSEHNLLITHLLGEQATYITSSKGREGWVWKPVKKGGDNHWLDVGAYCCVIGSLLECRKGEETAKPQKRKVKKVSLKEKQKMKRGGV